MIKASIIGANGYTGLELMNLLSCHPQAKIAHIVSRSNAGIKARQLYPTLHRLGEKRFENLDLDAIAEGSDVVFSALPHSASAEVCGKLCRKGLKVIDLSADFRYRDKSVYEQWYKVKHPCPELCSRAVYGLPEIYREKIRGAQIVGNPGCYTTCSILALYPLLKEKAISPDGIIIDAKSGTSGAGRKAEADLSFCEVNENFKAYAVTTHRHTSEIEQELSLAAGRAVALSFTPHLLPIQRGILATIYCEPERGVMDGDIYSVYQKYYAGEPFVVINEEGVFPEIKHVRHSNYISIGFKLDKRINRLIIISALDNLVKGASGQAIQNMNIMFGLDERAGLEHLSRYI